MTDINTTKFYQFIATKNTSEQSWVDYVETKYGNQDDFLIVSEFRKFMEAEFDWSGCKDNQKSDLIEQFWSTIDINKSEARIELSKWRNKNTLDKDEVENLNTKLRYCQEYENYIKTKESEFQNSGLSTKNEGRWKKSVIEAMDELLEDYLNGEYDCTLTEHLDSNFATIKNQKYAEWSAVDYEGTDNIKNILAQYPEYAIGDDETLQKLINNYIASYVNSDSNLDDIQNNIKGIVKAYLIEAGINESDFDDSSVSAYNDLTSLGFDKTAINPLQEAVLYKDLTVKICANKPENFYEGYEGRLNQIIEEYINNCKNDKTQFSDIKDGISTINAADLVDTKDLDKDIIANMFDDIRESKDPNSFYQSLVSEFGEFVAQYIAKNDKKGDKYEKILNKALEDIYNKINNGESITKDDIKGVQVKIIEALQDCFEDFVIDDIKNESVISLNNLYDKWTNNSTSINTNNTITNTGNNNEKHIRNAAIIYCTVLHQKGEDYAALVENIFFGEDYRKAIEEILSIDKIIQWMNDLKEVAIRLSLEQVPEENNTNEVTGGNGGGPVNENKGTNDPITNSEKNDNDNTLKFDNTLHNNNNAENGNNIVVNPGSTNGNTPTLHKGGLDIFNKDSKDDNTIILKKDNFDPHHGNKDVFDNGNTELPPMMELDEVLSKNGTSTEERIKANKDYIDGDFNQPPVLNLKDPDFDSFFIGGVVAPDNKTPEEPSNGIPDLPKGEKVENLSSSIQLGGIFVGKEFKKALNTESND